jgi:hypothetical protein
MKNVLYGIVASLTLFSGTVYAGLPSFDDSIDFYFGNNALLSEQRDLTQEELGEALQLEANLLSLESVLPGTSLSLFGRVSHNEDNGQLIEKPKKKRKKTSSITEDQRRENNIIAAHKSRLVEYLLLESNKQKKLYQLAVDYRTTKDKKSNSLLTVVSKELKGLNCKLQEKKNYTQYELRDVKDIFLPQVETIIKTPRFTKAAVAGIADTIFIEAPTKKKQKKNVSVASDKRREKNRLAAQARRQKINANIARIIYEKKSKKK